MKTHAQSCSSPSFTSCCIVGGAGFIGSHFADALLAHPGFRRLTVLDNLSSGRAWHLEAHRADPRLHFVHQDAASLDALTHAFAGHEAVLHLASNPDIARAATEPRIDFHQGTALTYNVVEAARLASVPLLLYASGSGVYGEQGARELHEDFGPLLPVSTYGASKLAGEALLSSYAAMFAIRACAFRFGNVVGPRQTHGVGFDFLRRLRTDPHQLTILGDGTQTKSYIHVSDVIRAVLTAAEHSTAPYSVYNVATLDTISVSEIAALAAECCGAAPRLHYTGGDRGWKGDVPLVRLNTDRIRALGWASTMTSREALRSSMLAMLPMLVQLQEDRALAH